MHSFTPGRIALLLMLACTGRAGAQTVATLQVATPYSQSGLPAVAAASAPVLAEPAATLPAGDLQPLDAVPAPKAEPAVMQGCRPLTDEAMTADFQAVTAQAGKSDLAAQAKLLEQAVQLWTKAAAQCEGHAKDRALQSLDDDSKMLVRVSEKLDSGPQCAAAHKDASALQDIARQALSERRWLDAARLFRKAENMWDYATERCSGSQQNVAMEHRSQSATDGHNAEFCAPIFESAREATQRLRAGAGTLSHEQKQTDSLVAETLWRSARDSCQGAAVKDVASSNAAALARQRGTPWVATVAARDPGLTAVAPGAAASVAVGSDVAKLGTTPVAAPAVLLATATPAPAAASKRDASELSAAVVRTAVVSAAVPEVTPTPALPTGVQMAGTTQFIGGFVRDVNALTFSGTGKVAWATGDVFEGTLVLGKRQGKGVMVWANGQRYEGDWRDDQPTGVANIRFVNGNQYEGQEVDSVPLGEGHMRYASGDTYTGHFTNGEPDGQGVYVWTNGQKYEGPWRNGRPNGAGKLKFANGNLYEGVVVNGTPNGQGKMAFATGEIYDGAMVNGYPEGEGTFSWPSGDQYIGQWKAGKKHGKGVFTWKSGQRWEGIYDNDVQGSAVDEASPKS
ncbi:hypothetical protein [Rhodoferax sp.]|uniref:MORN repeat-containing protein n=1 Tax=Rhodoferax sp. TaxID=50421 RepID=UPI00284F1288|nr:hypothetical protein [Rhodoferax sp.]MDR3371460.1 hypothetical protein [Rhodoferax sp.]